MLLLPLSKQVEAGYGSGFYPVYQVRQHAWRPNTHAPRSAPGYRWRPVEPVVPAQRNARDQVLHQQQSRWVRSARPLKRGGELASQFRPDHRYGEPVKQPKVVLDLDSEQHAQFRPIEPSAPRRTYEEIYEQQKPAVRQQGAPLMPYPTVPYIPPPMPMPGAPYWPYW